MNRANNKSNVNQINKRKKKSQGISRTNTLTTRTISSDGNQVSAFNLLKVPRNSYIMPDRLYTKLVFSGSNTLTVLAASNTAALRYRPSSAFDVDPLIGGTSMPGFTELGNIYATYRVTSSRIKISAVLGTTSPAGTPTLVVVPLTVDPSGTPSAATVQSWAGNPYSKFMLLPTNGSEVTTIISEMSTEKIFGSKEVYYDSNFSSVVTASPATNWFWGVGLNISPSVAANVTVAYLFKLEIGLEFYDRSRLAN
jgi:hypothetical protein